jgi:peptidoglycan/xylan/chitin deacetylase (PgdA/CDA1 family)
MTPVTVVIPALDCAASLQSCLAAPGLSVGDERPRIIVADNGSTDSTASVAAALGAEPLSVARIGPAAARNGGLEAVETEYVAFLDADCIALSGWLDALCRDLRQSSHIAVGGALRWRSADAKVAAFYQDHYPTNETLCAAGSASYLLTANAIFRRRELQDAGGFDTRLSWCEDLELGIRLTRDGATLGYSSAAVVELDAPSTLLDRFSQFYKYGFGLERVQALHPGVIEWNPAGQWSDVVLAARSAWRDPKERRLMFETKLPYFAGWADAKLRRRLCRQKSDALTVCYRRMYPDAQRRVALSIDDGPSDVTPALLRLLDHYNAKATFFVIGQRAAEHPSMLAEIASAGHEIFAHGWSHRRLDCLARDEIRAEFDRTEALLREVRRTPRPYLVRLPYGAGAEDPHVHAALRAWNPDAEIVQWSATLWDWKFRFSHEPAVACARALDWLVSTGELPGAILLLHDTPFGSNAESAGPIAIHVLDQALKSLCDRGFSVTTVGRNS